MVNLTDLTNSLKDHGRKYGIIGLVMVVSLGSCYHRASKEANRSSLINQSLLALSPRNVQGPLLMVHETSPQVASSRNLGSEAKQPYIPEEGKVIITPKDPTKKISDVINIKVQKMGFCFKPGLKLNLLPYGIGLDIKFAYAYRFGATVGMSYLRFLETERISPTIGVTYHPWDNFFKNTDLFIDYTPVGPAPVAGGLRISF